MLNRCFLDDSLKNVLAGINATCKGISCPNFGYSSSSSSGDWVTTLLADVWNFRGYIFGYGLGIATVVAFVYLYLLRIPGILFLVIWSIILSIEVLLVIGGILLMGTSSSWKDYTWRCYRRSSF